MGGPIRPSEGTLVYSMVPPDVAEVRLFGPLRSLWRVRWGGLKEKARGTEVCAAGPGG